MMTRRLVVRWCWMGAVCVLAGQPARGGEVTPRERSEWRALFNGKDLDGWYLFLQKAERDADPTRVVTIEDGTIHVYKHDRNGAEVVMGYMGTREVMRDYHLRAKYRWGKKQFPPRYLYKPDAGIYFHHVSADAVWPETMQCQVELNGVGDLITVGANRLETTVDPATLSDKWQEHLPAKQGGVAYTTAGKGITYTRKHENYEQDGWNTVDLICRGSEAAVLVNGRLVNRCRKMERLVDGKWVPLVEGKILIEFEASEMWWRDIEARALAEGETLEAAIGRAEDDSKAASAERPAR